MENPSTSAFSPSSLLCPESQTFFSGEELLREQEQEQEQEDPSLASLITRNGFSDSEDEYVHLLLKKENHHKHTHYSSSSSVVYLGKSTKLARLNAINSILNTNVLLGFQLQTAFLSVIYLDRFLSLRTLDAEKAWAIELLSIGCLSLAAKLQECNVPGLPSFQNGSFSFETEAVQRMEILILSTLEWKMESATPFSFMPYFINKFFSGPPPKITLKRMVEFIIAFMKEISLVDHLSSAIASAAVLMSLDERLTRNELDSKLNSLPCIKFLDTDDVSICYFTMQNLEKKQRNTLKLLNSPDQSSIKINQMGSFSNSPATSSISSKRRRLSFGDNDVEKRRHYQSNKT